MGNASKLQLDPQVWGGGEAVPGGRDKTGETDVPHDMEVSLFITMQEGREFCPKEQPEPNRILSLHFGGSSLSSW